MNITATHTWPAGLPLPYYEYSGESRAAIAATTTNYPFLEKRNRFSKPYQTLTVTWCFTRAQYETFEEFWETIGNGSASFVMELKYPYASVLTSWMIRFMSDFQATREDFYWKVQAQLDVLDPATLPSVASLAPA